MSTRSVVAKLTDDEGLVWKGRYVHSDGYPSNMVPTLQAIYFNKDQDVERIITRLINFNPGWSYLDASAGRGQHLEGRAHGVSGYGVAYSTKVFRNFAGTENYQQARWEDWETNLSTDSWCEWAYVLTESGIAVYRFDYDPEKHWEYVRTVGWAEKVEDYTIFDEDYVTPSPVLIPEDKVREALEAAVRTALEKGDQIGYARGRKDAATDVANTQWSLEGTSHRIRAQAEKLVRGAVKELSEVARGGY